MSQDTSPDFPSELINVDEATLELADGEGQLSIKLIPFTIDGEAVDQTLDFTLEECPGISDLAGQTFEFPPNPEDGYVEGSIYIWGVHNPIDLNSITFGQVDQNKIKADVNMTFGFEFEGERRNLTKAFHLYLQIL